MIRYCACPCGEPFEGGRADQKFKSNACRVRAMRERRSKDEDTRIAPDVLVRCIRAAQEAQRRNRDVTYNRRRTR